MGQTYPDLYAVVGQPVAHSLSPRIHQLFASAYQQTLEYTTIAPEIINFAPTVREFFSGGGKGLNITSPFKPVAFKLCDASTSLAKQAQAVNTLWQENGQLHGDSTDGPGCVKDLTQRHGVNLEGASILIVGAGGTVASLLPSLCAAKPARIHIANRTPAKAMAILTQFHSTIAITTSDLNVAPQPFDLLMNATSLSLQGKPLPLTDALLAECQVYYDCVYGVAAAPILNIMQAKGIAQVYDGLGMLVEQAALSFQRWRKILPETEPVYQQLRKTLQEN